jgi:hypothetical protein
MNVSALHAAVRYVLRDVDSPDAVRSASTGALTVLREPQTPEGAALTAWIERVQRGGVRQQLVPSCRSEEWA